MRNEKKTKKEKVMKSKLFNEVVNFKVEMESTGSVEGVSNLMNRIKNSNEPVENKLTMMGSIKNSCDIVLGNKVEKNFNSYELSKSPYGRKS